jgi:hypothetical protein
MFVIVMISLQLNGVIYWGDWVEKFPPYDELLFT